jgi:chromosome segregation ATPase
MDRLKVLEAKCAKLEEDQFAVSEARDAARQRLATAEMEIGDLKTQVTVLHEVRKERDLLNTRVDKMKKGLEELLGADTAMADSFRPATVREKTPRNKVPAIPAAGSAAKTFPQ